MLYGGWNVERFLVGCVQQRDLAALLPVDEVSIERIPAAASHHGVAGFVHRAVAGNGLVPPPVEARLRDEAARSAMLGLQVLADLGRIVDALDGADIAFLVLKGPVLDRWVHRQRGCRGYNDLDLLVAPSHLGAAVEVLEDHRSVLLDRNWGLLRSEFPGEVHLRAPMGTIVDLHWHVLNTAALRSTFNIDSDELMAHSMRVPMDGFAVPALDPAAMLIQVSLHACLSGADRLVWLKDVEQCASADGLDWDQVSRLAARWAVSQPLAVVLTRTKALLGLDIPADARRELGVDRGYCRLGRALDRVWPVLRADEGRTPGRLVAKATRRNGWDSAGELLGRSVRALIDLPRYDGTRISRDPDDPASPVHPDGSESDRTEFFRRIAATGSP